MPVSNDHRSKMEAVDMTLAQYLDLLADRSEGGLIHTAQLAEIVIVKCQS